MQPDAPNGQPSVVISPDARRRARRYRAAAGIILLLGIISAGMVYWLGSRESDDSDDPGMVGFNRAEQHQMGVLYGKQGELIEDLDDALKQPGTQAILIVIAAAIIATGFFYFARVVEYEATEAAANGPDQH